MKQIELKKISTLFNSRYYTGRPIHSYIIVGRPAHFLKSETEIGFKKTSQVVQVDSFIILI